MSEAKRKPPAGIVIALPVIEAEAEGRKLSWIVSPRTEAGLASSSKARLIEVWLAPADSSIITILPFASIEAVTPENELLITLTSEARVVPSRDTVLPSGSSSVPVP